MNSCSHKEPYLDRSLGTDAKGRFEDHLERCESCASAVRAWRDLRPRVADELSGPDVREPTELDVHQLVERAHRERVEQSADRRRWPVIAAAAVLVLIIPSALIFKDTLEREDPLVESVSDEPIVELAIIGPGDEHPRRVAHPINLPIDSAPGGGTVVEIGDDLVTLFHTARLRFAGDDSGNTLLKLDYGKILCVVSPKDLGDSFTVEAGRFRVQVIGTRFSIERRSEQAIEVAVSEGIVEVLGPGNAVWRLEPGDRLRLPEEDDENVLRTHNDAREHRIREVLISDEGEGGTPRRPGKPVFLRSRGEINNQSDDDKSDIARFRAWIITGRYDDASGGLTEWLSERPKDQAAWSLLADCHRKAGKWERAVEAYGRVIALTPPERANRARFLSGVIFQDQLERHDEAAAMFEQHLETDQSTSPQRTAATLRLARTYIALGRTERARRLLEDVVTIASDTPSGQRAAALLEQLGARKKNR